MNNRQRPNLIFLILVAAIQIIYFAAEFAAGGRLNFFLFAVHVTVFLLAAIYVVYTEHRLQLGQAKTEMLERVIQQIPCGIRIIDKNLVTLQTNFFYVTIQEAYALCDNKLHAKLIEQVFLTGQPVYTQPYCVERNAKFHTVEHCIVPIKDGDNVAFVVDMAFDMSDLLDEAKRRELEYTMMIKILVNMFEIKDPFSEGHSETVSNLAQEIARALGLSTEEIDILIKAALLHDIGKIVIPTEILNKTDPLTDEDYIQIRRHSTVGADILASMKVFHSASDIVRHHHECFDGKGYPAGLAGNDIPLGARILAVADAFDAMTAGRTVRGKLSVALALERLQAERGRQFDPIIVDAFVKLVTLGRDDDMIKEMPS